MLRHSYAQTQGLSTRLYALQPPLLKEREADAFPCAMPQGCEKDSLTHKAVKPWAPQPHRPGASPSATAACEFPATGPRALT